jgi:hypothetical protein
MLGFRGVGGGPRLVGVAPDNDVHVVWRAEHRTRFLRITNNVWTTGTSALISTILVGDTTGMRHSYILTR